ncbi:MAG: hypothetical protein R2747_04250 [Pyrinomonadaceae bacterium]
MKIFKNEQGFSYVEVIVAILIMTIGILAMLSAISLAMLRAKESDSRNTARQITSSALESIFAARDLRNNNPLNNWSAIDNNTAGTPAGIFVSGWTPIRESGGLDGIHGTADDACATGTNCTVGTYTNSSPEMVGFERKITITNVIINGSPDPARKNVEISVRFRTGQLVRTETINTIVADLPFNN